MFINYNNKNVTTFNKDAMFINGKLLFSLMDISKGMIKLTDEDIFEKITHDIHFKTKKEKWAYEPAFLINKESVAYCYIELTTYFKPEHAKQLGRKSYSSKYLIAASSESEDALIEDIEQTYDCYYDR